MKLSTIGHLFYLAAIVVLAILLAFKSCNGPSKVILPPSHKEEKKSLDSTQKAVENLSKLASDSIQKLKAENTNLKDENGGLLSQRQSLAIDLDLTKKEAQELSARIKAMEYGTVPNDCEAIVKNYDHFMVITEKDKKLSDSMLDNMRKQAFNDSSSAAISQREAKVNFDAFEKAKHAYDSLYSDYKRTGRRFVVYVSMAAQYNDKTKDLAIGAGPMFKTRSDLAFGCKLLITTSSEKIYQFDFNLPIHARRK